MTDNKEYRCLTCKDIIIQGKDSPSFPFCSKRCKMADLGRWFTGDYHIKDTLPADELENSSASETESY